MNVKHVLCTLILGWIGFLPTGMQANVSAQSVSIMIDQPIHFLGVDGSDILVGPGSYLVEITEHWLKLVPEERRNAILIEAEPGIHQETLLEPIAKLNMSDEEVGEIVLLLPDGNGWRATGTISGITSRGLPRTKPRLALRDQRASTPSQTPRGGKTVLDALGKRTKDGSFFTPPDPWDKFLLNLVQELGGKVKQLETELSKLKNRHSVHRHNYEDRTPGGNAWVSIRQLRKMQDDESHHYDNYGLYFKKEPKASTVQKVTGKPK